MHVGASDLNRTLLDGRHTRVCCSQLRAACRRCHNLSPRSQICCGAEPHRGKCDALGSILGISRCIIAGILGVACEVFGGIPWKLLGNIGGILEAPLEAPFLQDSMISMCAWRRSLHRRRHLCFCAICCSGVSLKISIFQYASFGSGKAIL